ncbi:hypothetical protein LJC07_01135 [Christensenellaceae bacterium OttesenSCG-928-L17]|nr:hypothetical protein [Christensenellaceae bacterium OttesenSCG-928-L17]
MDIPVLYEDNHILVVEKPVNIPVQADASHDADLLSILKDYIKEKYNKPGAVYLGLVHRLDRPVGGAMVFARTSKAASRLSAQFAAGEAQKRYVAVVEGTPPADAFYEDFILSVEGETRVRVLGAPQEGAKRAALRMHTICREHDTALLDIALLTGRKHQIRAQMAAHGHPIRFDQRYHPAPKRGQIALWAYELRFLHPTTKECLTFTSLPRGGAFAAYAQQIQGLPASRAGYVAYADEHLLVADKQAEVEVTITDGGAQSLEAGLAACFGVLYPVHRLDANTKGLVLFARDEETQAALVELLRDGDIEKYYRCLVTKTPVPREAVLHAYAKKDAVRGELTVRDTAFSGSVPIQTGYRVQSEGEYTELEVRLFTGRTHQIRAHLSHIGCPILGDDKYGDRAENRRKKVSKQALIASRLVLHTTKNAALMYLNGRTFHSSFSF